MSQKRVSTPQKYHRAKQWEIALFSLNNSATNLYLFAFGFLAYYSTGLVGLTTFIVGNILGAVRLFDGLIDPTIGIIIDRFGSRWGKFRPIMVVGNISLILSFIILFNTYRFEGVAMYAIYGFALIFHKIGYSFQQTVTKAAQPALTNDPSQRPLFSIYDTFFSAIGIFAVGQTVVSNFLVPRHGGEFSLAFFTEFITGICLMSAVLTVLAVIGISRKDQEKYLGLGDQTVETKSFKDNWSVIKGNTPLQTLAIAGGLMKFVVQMSSDQAFLIILFGIILGDFGLSGQIALYQIIPNFILIMLMTVFASKRDLKDSYTLSICLALLSAITMGVILFTSDNPTQLFSQGGLLPIAFMVAYIGFKVFNAYPASIVLTMAADITDYETARSGRFVSGLIGTVFSLTDSIASSMAPIVIGLIVAAIGYTDTYPQVGEQLTPALMTGGMILVIVIPVVSYLFILALIRRYPLNRAAMEQVQETIESKKLNQIDSEDTPDLIAKSI